MTNVISSKRMSLVIILLLIGFMSSNAQVSRIKVSVNENWKFLRNDQVDASNESFDDTNWESISLPHTWNNRDVEDEAYGYYRGVSWYRKHLSLDQSWQNKKVFIYFEGSNQVSELFVNGKKVGKHIGGYASFCFDISPFLNAFSNEQSENIISVKVNNAHNENIPPLSADFTFYGGIYRDVYLVGTPQVHFDLLDYGSEGIFIETPLVNENQGQVKIRASVKNEESASKKLTVLVDIFSPKGEIVCSQTKKVVVDGNSLDEIILDKLELAKPLLWSPNSPNLYQVRCRLIDTKKNSILDELINPLGFRWFKFTADKGFFLNGKPLKLMGANRHQDYPDMGNALSDQLHFQDMKLLKEMGANFIRIAHYQQDPSILEACDKLGLIASVEIPIVNTITETIEFEQNCLDMTRELVRRDYNHPSVMIWAYMNEIMLGMRYRNDKEKRDPYIQSIVNLAQKIEDIIRKEDPYRYTMIPNGGAFNTYKNPGITDIAMIVGWNLYPGWYGSDLGGFERFLDLHKKELSHKPMIVSEYGAGADPRIRSFSPKRFDFSIEYQNKYNWHYYQAMMERDFVAGGLIWNFVDFNSEHRVDAVPHVNNKGMLTRHRIPKDVYCYYQIMLKDEDQVIIPSKLWAHRAGDEQAEGTGICTQTFDVYSNMKEVELWLNGVLIGVNQPVEGICTFDVPFKNGKNVLEAVGKKENQTQKDFINIEFDLIPFRLDSQTTPFNQISVNVGSHCFFLDDELNQVWMPEKEYTAGSWGYLGGDKYLSSGWKLGTSKNILGTNNNPLYQTQRSGLQSFKFDVPSGKYEITLCLSELMTNKEMSKLVYNLGADTQDKKTGRRIFTVKVNGTSYLKDLNIRAEFGEFRAIEKKIEVIVEKNKGLELSFEALEGKAVLNGISLRRIY